jgi:hypothetical protein
MLKIFWFEKVKERYHFEDLRVDWKIILEWILGKWGAMVRTERFWLID